MSAQLVLIVGQGYVGLPLAIRAVEAGFDVTGLDLASRRSSASPPASPTSRTPPNTRLRTALDSGRYTATSAIDEVERFDVAFISVPTPLKEGIPDLFDVGWATLRSAATKKETKSDPAQPGADLEADPSDLVVDVEPASVVRPGRSGTRPPPGRATSSTPTS